MSLCLTVAGKATALGLSAFTLGWSHSVEKTRWEEDWRQTQTGLVLLEARVEGSGAGMEPGVDAVFEDGWWRWRPDLPPQQALVLAASGATAGGWSLCGKELCRNIGAERSEPLRIAACDGS